MGKPHVSVKLGFNRPIFMLGILVLLICIATLCKFYSIRSLFISDTFCNCNNFHIEHQSNTRSDHVGETVGNIVQKIQKEVIEVKDLRMDSASAAFLSRYVAFLADILQQIESLQTSLPSAEGSHQQNTEIGALHPLLRPNQTSAEPADFFLTEEIRKYVRIKPNRLGKHGQCLFRHEERA